MKVYRKKINDKLIIKPANKIIVIKDGMQTINPTHDMIIEDGWEEYVIETVETPMEETLESVKEEMVQMILNHDSSESVNVFYVGGRQMWLDKATRVGLKLRFESELENGMTETTLWYNGIPFPLNLDDAVKMLHSIEIYASMCYDNTQMHIANVRAMEDIESVKAYDYYTGYPDVLNF